MASGAVIKTVEPPTRTEFVRELLLSVEGAINTMLSVTPYGTNTAPRTVVHHFAGRYEQAVAEVVGVVQRQIEQAGHGRPLQMKIERHYMTPQTERVIVCSWEPGRGAETDSA